MSFKQGTIQSLTPCSSKFIMVGKAKHTIHTLNNIIRNSLIQASLPPYFWVEALLSATHIFNLLPTTTLHLKTRLKFFLVFPLLWSPSGLWLSLLPKSFLNHPSQTRSSFIDICLSWPIHWLSGISLSWFNRSKSDYFSSCHFWWKSFSFTRIPCFTPIWGL